MPSNTDNRIVKVTFQDLAPFSGDREKTTEGYLRVNVVATAVGLQQYLGSELGIADADMVTLYRTPETVFDTETLDSFDAKPVTIGHAGETITAETHRSFSVGTVLGKGFRGDNKQLLARIQITDAATVKQVEDGELTGVSLGYDMDFEVAAGEYEGNQFQVRTVGPMSINHLTLLPDAMPPRVAEARVLDSSKGESGMSKKDTATDQAKNTDQEEEKKQEDTAAMDEAALDALADKVADMVLAKLDQAKADAAEEGDEDDDEDKPAMDAAAIEKMVADKAVQRAQVLAVTGQLDSSESSEKLIKDALPDGVQFTTVDHGIGYLQGRKAANDKAASPWTDAAAPVVNNVVSSVADAIRNKGN